MKKYLAFSFRALLGGLYFGALAFAIALAWAAAISAAVPAYRAAGVGLSVTFFCVWLASAMWVVRARESAAPGEGAARRLGRLVDFLACVFLGMWASFVTFDPLESDGPLNALADGLAEVSIGGGTYTVLVWVATPALGIVAVMVVARLMGLVTWCLVTFLGVLWRALAVAARHSREGLVPRVQPDKS